MKTRISLKMVPELNSMLSCCISINQRFAIKTQLKAESTVVIKYELINFSQFV